MSLLFWFYVNSWGRAKIEKFKDRVGVNSGTIFMYYRKGYAF